MSKAKPIVFDIDGTLFFPSEERIALAKEKNWDKFHQAMPSDKPNTFLFEAIAQLENVFYCSSIPEKFLGLVIERIRSQGIVVSERNFLLRPRGCFYPAPRMKYSLLRSAYFNPDNTGLIVDDHKGVRKLLNEKGYNVADPAVLVQYEDILRELIAASTFPDHSKEYLESLKERGVNYDEHIKPMIGSEESRWINII